VRERPSPDVAVDAEVHRIVRPQVCAFDDLVVREVSPPLDAALTTMAAPARLGGGPVHEDVMAAVRAMYRRTGVDPTKTRPSSEALLRRVRRGDAFPRVNSLVDVINWCSLERQLPYGLYDLAAIEGLLSIRLGREGEAYAGIRKDVVHLTGRLVLADERGAFGNPTSDSWRTRVTTETTSALVVVFAPAALPVDVATLALATTRERIAAFCA
jgi:DNA/RNA-binding domain of Phe-tRNA-synthetase-like protein